MDAHGLPVRMIVTGGTTADCACAEALIDGFVAGTLMADRAYDTNALLDWCDTHRTQAVIPSRRHRRHKRPVDEDLYKLRHIIENAILKLKQWRAVATRYAKTTASFLAECQIAATMLWIR